MPSLDSQNPESERVAAGYLLHRFGVFADAPVTIALPVALGLAVLVWVFLRFTVRGYELRAAGANPEASRVAGIDVRAVQTGAMTLAGALAGAIGLVEVCGNAGRFRIGFSADFGFIGIPVALLARAHPLGVIFGALLFGALQKGTADLDLETTHVTRDLAAVIQAAVVLAVSVEGGIHLWRRRRRPGVEPAATGETPDV
jgi:simple sugar transport system permease protein